MVTNAYGVEVTAELSDEAARIERALYELRQDYDALLERLGVPLGDGYGAAALSDGIDDATMDLARFTDPAEA